MKTVVLCVLCTLARAPSEQAPVGGIAGLVRDRFGGAIRGAQVEAVSSATRQVRRTLTGPQGEYSLPTLAIGEYEITVAASGFQRVIRVAAVEAGTTTSADFVLDVGDVTESVSVAAAVPTIRYDSAAIGGVITRNQIEGLPLNGRSFLELAKLEPGGQLPTASNRNRTIVHVLGAPAANVGGARFTIDGGSVTAVGLGGAQMALSQEVVQEFQVSSVNFDLAAGMTDSGAINVVTRSGGNDARASAFYFFRDHHLSAYPTLTRDPRNPRPFFQRQQLGAAAGGPLRRDRLFYFGTWERNDQRAVSATELLDPSFAHFSRVTSSPFRGDLFTLRLDGRINAHSIFMRYSRDDSDAFGPGATVAGGSPNAFPSNWNRVFSSSEQSLLAFTSVLGPRLVNDLRLSFFALSTQSHAPREDDCPRCLGMAAPSITIAGTGLVIGHSNTLDNLERRLQLAESITWQADTHRVRLGIDWEHNRDRNLVWNNEPVTITLYSPARVRAHNAQPGLAAEQAIPLPASFTALDDILQLPLHSMIMGIGEPGVRQEGGGIVRRWNTVWAYADDVWRMRDRLTLTYGMGWGFDGILNHDLRKPTLLTPILGSDGLHPTRRRWTNFSPAVGVIWAASSERTTVVRAAAGRFYRPHGLTGAMDAERVALGPPGLARQSVPGSAILNILPGLPGVALGAPLDFRRSPTRFTGADLLAILPGLKQRQLQVIAAADRTVQQIEIAKQLAGANTAIFPADVPNPSAVHGNVGLQREMLPGVVLGADLVYRHFTHVPQNGGAIDVNHFNSERGPAIRACGAAELSDPAAQCSAGAINVYVAPYEVTYKGLLIRAEKRWTDGWQALASYAFAKNSGINAGIGFNLEDWRRNRGPTANDVTHVLNLSGMLRLPWGVNLGANFAYASMPPFTAFIGDADLDGDGTTNDLLPGTTANGFNRGMERADLERLVREFNTKHADSVFAPLTLPARYALGDDFHSLDIRLSRSFVVGSRACLSLVGETFNLYNASNLTEYSGDLTADTFGQPLSRVRHLFGSGGPRSLQVAMRVSF